MYQLSHMLTEQQNVMQSLQEISITDSKGSTNNVSAPQKTEEDPRRSLSTLLEKVEGCTRLLDAKDRHIVRTGEMTEVREDGAECKIYIVLLSDGLLLADWLPHRRGTVQYRFQMLYELDNLAVVNVKEDQRSKNCFKILTFPHARQFQCETAAEKRVWMEAIEQTKQAKMAAVSLKRESALLDPKGSLLSIDNNPFDEEEAEELYECESGAVLPEWLSELPEDLDVCVAERDFEGAVSLVLKTEEHFALYPNAKPLEEMNAILKYSMRQQKMEGATAPYIKKLCELFFSSMVETGQEFTQAFSTNNSCASSFVVWAKDQLQNFVKLFSNHVFTTQVSLSVATECILAVRTHCERLWEIGLDLSFFLEKLLKNDVERIITDSRDKALEAIKLRAAEDRWRPQNLYNNVLQQDLFESSRRPPQAAHASHASSHSGISGDHLPSAPASLGCLFGKQELQVGCENLFTHGVLM
ncbi:hypothetical protein HPB51_019695 [Rhipicephalus microplus]|uniref:Exocyst complex component 8 n=1 Tax=Rhipicephalus microplus TaxID=6941 RepID=A0A9J6F591_RHIMP|nr:hypothetical protein HPB51_019695 [Rhipicephalus microplus]